MSLVWYVSYGSNMHLDRFVRYLDLCRDPTPPAATRPLIVPGGVYFATESPIWGGGRAFYDADLPRTTAGRAYLITERQFADVVEQEMYRPPGQDLDLRPVLRPALNDGHPDPSDGSPGLSDGHADLSDGRPLLGDGYHRPGSGPGRHALGPGRYETLLHLGDHDGHPALTFTAPWRAQDVEHTAPSAPYLKMLKEGLRAAHGWTPDRIAAYLAACTTFWTPQDIESL